MLTATAVAAVSGCGGAEADSKKPAAAAPSVTAATKTFQDAVAEFDASDGCPKAVGGCWEKMQAVTEPAQELREAMNADKAGPEF